MDFRNRHIDLVGKMPLWFGISLTVILVGLVSWAMFGLNRGIDFRGGTQVQYRLPVSQRPGSGKDVALVQEVRDLLEKAGLQNARAQIAGGDTLIVNAPALSQSEQTSQQRRIYAALAPRLQGTDAAGKPQELRLIAQQFVGPVIGRELERNAILGVVIGVCLIAAWIFIRYNFAGDGLRYAVAGVAALVHDVLALIGIFALIGHFDPRIEVDGSFIAALLTVVGYSINDSVVIFDRLRENLRVRRNEPVQQSRQRFAAGNDESLDQHRSDGAFDAVRDAAFRRRKHLQLRAGDAGRYRAGLVFLDFQRFDGASRVAQLGREKAPACARKREYSRPRHRDGGRDFKRLRVLARALRLQLPPRRALPRNPMRRAARLSRPRRFRLRPRRPLKPRAPKRRAKPFPKSKCRKMARLSSRPAMSTKTASK